MCHFNSGISGISDITPDININSGIIRVSGFDFSLFRGVFGYHSGILYLFGYRVPPLYIRRGVPEYCYKSNNPIKKE